MYNKELYLPFFLQSIANQSFLDYELILVNDGSTDNSKRIIDEYCQAHKNSFAIHQSNKGVCEARNVGIRAASGEYLYIVDTDDWLDTNALHNISRAVKEMRADVIYGQAYIESPKGNTLDKPFPKSFVTESKRAINEIQCALLNNSFIRSECEEFYYIWCLGGAPWRAAIRRDLVVNNNILFKEGLSLGEDILFWQMVFDYVKKVAYIDSTFYHYRLVSQSLSHGYKPNLLDLYNSVFKAETEYLLRTNKSKEHWDAFYFRIISYIKQSINDLFNNDLYEGKGYKDFVSTIKGEPYKTAIKKVDFRRLVRPKPKIAILLLKCHLYGIYWIINVIKGRQLK